MDMIPVLSDCTRNEGGPNGQTDLPPESGGIIPPAYPQGTCCAQWEAEGKVHSRWCWGMRRNRDPGAYVGPPPEYNPMFGWPPTPDSQEGPK